MTTTYSTDAARAYLDRVRELLSDLPEEERAELLQDLAAHLDELGDADLEAELGSPEAFVAEFRTMAGLERSEVEREGFFSLLARRMEALRHHPMVERAWDRWPQVRPVWVGIRGWLLVALAAVLLSRGTAFRGFPIPEVENSAVAGVVAVVAATWLSVAAARRAMSQERAWRVINVSLNVAVGWMLLLSLFNGFLYTSNAVHTERAMTEQWIRDDIDSLLPTDLVATTPDGEELEAVRLYDQDGRPFDLARIRWQLGLPWPYADDPGVEPSDEAVRNLYPMRSISGGDQVDPASEIEHRELEESITTTTTIGR